ncbi:MAG TPA: hypothetical protein VFQ36_13955 [Ktedonobacteraceae bacterium]|nr:hypothetical protein [Ktedonobacteraceae bacterium]
MSQSIASRCYSCGWPVNPQEDDFCPDCHYPVSPAKEEEYLTSALASLQQAMSYGGSQLKVAELFRRYQNRLLALQKQKEFLKTSPEAFASTPEAAAPSSVRVTSVVYQMNTPHEGEIVAPPVPANPPEPRPLFSWRSFFADQAINIVASLGAFFILIGALSFVATTSNLLLAFLIVFIVHAAFGITGIVTHRFASFRIVANIYTIIFALLVPLVGFSVYRLTGGNELELSVPVLIAISATYATVVYTMLALFQRYAPFAYLAIAALAAADLALASALHLALWWWPSLLMVLALLSLVSIACSPGISRLFDGRRAILRQPVRIFMYVFVAMGTLGIVTVALYAIFLDGIFSNHSTEAGYAILCLSLLRLLWGIGSFYLARQTRGIVTLTLLLLVCVLAFCYAVQFDATGYALALTIVALFFAGISRYARTLLQPFGALELQLDWIALALVLLVPFIVSPLLPLQLAAQVYSLDSVAPYYANWQTLAGGAAIIAGIVLTLSIAFKRTAFYTGAKQSAWRWLLLLAAFLFTCVYGLLIVFMHLNPVWSFLGASIAFMVGALIARQRIDDAWAEPLDISALCIMLITLGLSLNGNPDVTSRILIFFFAATYAILFYQRRPIWLFVPTIFAIAALLLSAYSFWVFVFLMPALAMLAVVIRRFAGNAWAAPFAILALLAGIIVGVNGSFSNINLPFYGAAPGALLLYALVAFAAALVENRPAWLWLAAGFAFWGVVLATQLTPYYMTGIGMGAATTGIIVGRAIRISPERSKIAMPQHLRQFTWSWPWYVTALLAALLIGFWPQENPAQPVIIAYCMLGFTAIALVILLVERIPELLIFPAGFAALTIWLWYPRLDMASLMIAYTILCVVIFATQFIWQALPHTKGLLAATTLHEVLSIGGQTLVVLVILAQNGGSVGAGILAQVGAGALFVLAAMIFACGLLRPYTVMHSLPRQTDDATRLKRIQMAEETRRACYYIAGLLLSLVVSRELSAFRQTRLDVLLLAPATYLTIIAPFLMRDSTIRVHRAAGQSAAVLGACLLLLPTLWFSFSDINFVPTAILLGESLALLTLGMITRVRIFILSSASLVIVGTLRALFLATPPSLTLMLTGITLLLIATTLILTRHKLQVVWKRWD